MVKNNNEFEGLGLNDLNERVEALRRELFTLRLNAATQHVKDCSQFKKIRKRIARCLTHITQHEHTVGDQQGTS